MKRLPAPRHKLKKVIKIVAPVVAEVLPINRKKPRRDNPGGNAASVLNATTKTPEAKKIAGLLMKRPKTRALLQTAAKHRKRLFCSIRIVKQAKLKLKSKKVTKHRLLSIARVLLLLLLTTARRGEVSAADVDVDGIKMAIL